MAGKGCVAGALETTLYSSPVAWIGLYIALATSVCFFCMAFDLVCGSFIRKKPFLPCKLFPMNAFTLTVLAVATKIPNDLVTVMPRVEDQLSKLTGMALLCTSVGYYMPSLGTMETSERYGNLAALTVTVITMVVNVCIQIHTGVIFLFVTEQIIMMVCIVVLLLFMWSSAVALRENIDALRSLNRMIMHDARARVKNLDGLWNLIVDTHKFNYAGNRQTLLCKTPNHLTFGLVCVVSLVVVSQSMLKSFVLHSVKSCGTDKSDYRWSIFIVIVVQFLTIIVGSISIIYRWLSLLRHFDKFSLRVRSPQLELEYLKLKTLFPLRFINNKNLSNFLLVSKDFVVDVFIWIQIILYKCNIFLVGFPVYYVKRRLLVFIITGRKSLKDEEETHKWADEMRVKEMEIYRDSCKRDCPSNLKSLLSEYSPPGSISSKCATNFIGNFEDRGKEWSEENFQICDYRVSCLSVLVLSGILAELIPFPSRESLLQSLKESFEIIYFVDHNTIAIPNEEDERRWTSTKEVWGHWENPNHWFRTKVISRAYRGFKLQKVDDLGVYKDTLAAIEAHFNVDTILELRMGLSLTEQNMDLVSNEFAIICKFIGEQNYESVEDLFKFLEMYFVKMLCFTLSRLPLAILKEIDGEDPSEIAEARIRKAIKFCSKLEFLFDTMEWSEPLAKHSTVGPSFAAATDGADANEIV